MITPERIAAIRNSPHGPTVTELCDTIEALWAERSQLRRCVLNLLASAVPNERDHPTMCEAWNGAKEILARLPKEPE